LYSHHQKKAGQRGRQGERQQPELIKRKPAKKQASKQQRSLLQLPELLNP